MGLPTQDVNQTQAQVQRNLIAELRQELPKPTYS